MLNTTSQNTSYNNINLYQQMLKYSPTSSSLRLLLLVSALILSTMCEAGVDPLADSNNIPPINGQNSFPMQVKITNTPQFYYGKTCETTFTLITKYFDNPTPSTFEYIFFKIQNSLSGVRFLWRDKLYGLAQLRNAKVSKIKSLSGCGGLVDQYNFCVLAPSSNDPYADSRIRYNQTHNMMQITLVHTICPVNAQPKGAYHALFSVWLSSNSAGSSIKTKTSVQYSYTNLIYNYADTVLANPLINSERSYYYSTDSNILPAQAKNFYVGCRQTLSFVFEIRNQTQLNYWKTFKVTFSSYPQELSLNLLNCKKSISYATKGYSSYQHPVSSGIQCKMSETDNSLTFQNKDFGQDAYKQNPAFNVYQMFDRPGVRVNLTVQVTFKSATSYQIYYELFSNSKKRIGDTGELVNMPVSESTTFLLFNSSTNFETISGMKTPEFDTAVSYTRAYCSAYSPPASYNSFSELNAATPVVANSTSPSILPFNIQQSVFSITGGSLVIFLMISAIGSAWFVLGMKKPSINDNLKVPCIVMIALDPLVKLMFYAYVCNQDQGNSNKNSTLVTIFFIVCFVVEYSILNFSWVAFYYLKTKDMLSNTGASSYASQSQPRQNSKLILTALMAYSYKLYSLSFLGFHNNATLSKYNFQKYRFRVVNFTFLILIGMQIAIVCFLVFYFSKACLNQFVIGLYCFMQALYLLVLVNMFKFIYLLDNIKNQRQPGQIDDKTMYSTAYGGSQATGFTGSATTGHAGGTAYSGTAYTGTAYTGRIGGSSVGTYMGKSGRSGRSGRSTVKSHVFDDNKFTKVQDRTALGNTNYMTNASGHASNGLYSGTAVGTMHKKSPFKSGNSNYDMTQTNAGISNGLYTNNGANFSNFNQTALCTGKASRNSSKDNRSKHKSRDGGSKTKREKLGACDTNISHNSDANKKIKSKKQMKSSSHDRHGLKSHDKASLSRQKSRGLSKKNKYCMPNSTLGSSPYPYSEAQQTNFDRPKMGKENQSKRNRQFTDIEVEEQKSLSKAYNISNLNRSTIRNTESMIQGSFISQDSSRRMRI